MGLTCSCGYKGSHLAAQLVSSGIAFGICDDVMKGFPAGDPIYSTFRNYVIAERQLAASRVGESVGDP